MQSKSLEVLIVEDSFSYALELERVCKGLDFNVLDTVADSAQALDVIFSDSPDLILMDIDIGGKLSGLDIGLKIKHLDIPILYITSSAQETTKNIAQQSNIAGYLIKPVSSNRLLDTLRDIAANQLNIDKDGDANIMVKANAQKSLFFQKKGVFKKVDLKDIICVQADDNYCKFYVTDKEFYMMRITLKEVEEITKEMNFMKCHRGYIVNKDQLDFIDTTANKLGLKSGIKIPYSRSKKEDIRSILTRGK